MSTEDDPSFRLGAALAALHLIDEAVHVERTEDEEDRAWKALDDIERILRVALGNDRLYRPGAAS